MTIESASVTTVVWMHIWQIAVLVVAVGAVNLVIARRWPHLAYALWLVVLAKCFVPPIAGGPVSIWPNLATTVGWVESARPTDATIPTTNRAASPPSPPPVSESERNAAAAQSADQNAMVGLVPQPTLQRQLKRPAQAASFAWLFGSALLLGIAIGRGVEVGRRLRRTSIPVPDELQSAVQRLSGRIGLKLAPVSCKHHRTSGRWSPAFGGREFIYPHSWLRARRRRS
jgi:bla regulator protein blaR1